MDIPGFGLILIEYQTRLFTPWPSGKTFFSAPTAMGATAQNHRGDVVHCRGTGLWRRGRRFGSFPKHQEMKSSDFFKNEHFA